MIFAEPKPQLDVLHPVEYGVVNAALCQSSPAQHHRSMHDRADTTLQFLHQAVMPHKRHEGAELSPGAINERGGSANHCDPLMRVEKCDFLAEAVGKRDIVSILPCDIFSVSEPQCVIQRPCDPLIGLLEKDDPAIGITSDDLG